MGTDLQMADMIYACNATCIKVMGAPSLVPALTMCTSKGRSDPSTREIFCIKAVPWG